MRWLKAIIKYSLRVVVLILLILIVAAGVLFYKPTLLINPENIEYVLNKTHFFEKWSWSDANIHHKWIKWNERHIYGNFKDFCFIKKKPFSEVDACIDEAVWDFVVGYDLTNGLNFEYKSPLTVHSSKFLVSSRKDPFKKETNPPNATAIWRTLWLPIIPDITIKFDKIVITNLDKPEKKPLELNIQAEKIDHALHVATFGFDLNATPKKIVITGPKELVLPLKFKTRVPISLREIKLVAQLQGEKIPVTADAKINTAVLKLATTIDKRSLNDELGKPIFLKRIIAALTGSLEIEKVKETIKTIMRPPYNILPAPFNALEGYLNVNLKGESAEGNEVKFNLASELNMRSKTQAVHFVLDTSIPFALDKKELKGIDAELVIKRIALQLPQLARNRIPPQMIPDKRFKFPDKEKKKKSAAAKRKKQTPKDLDVKLEAIGNDTFNLKTNLLDEILRLNFDLAINEKGISTGYLTALPLKTSFFKRPINLKNFKITFNQPVIPQILAQLVFDLPEYKITLDIEGPINEPRHAFKSVPPLPLDDIYSVLLFGQPLSSLEDSDKESAQKTSELLQKGILSLAVLYYFAGTPVESIGYDPDTDVVTAQVGLGEKSSLHISGEEGGLNSAGVRRSLGKGWYIDSSVQKSSGPNNDFGVLLERIISY